MSEKLITYYHNKNNEVILKLLHNNTVKFKKIDCKPYFFIDKNDLQKTQQILQNFIFTDIFSNNTYKITFSFENTKNYIKVTYNAKCYLTPLMKNIQQLLDSHKIKHYELDLWPGDAYILDNDLEISDTYRILYFDIETKDTQGGIEIGRDRILSICAIDDNNTKYIFCDDDEYTILNNFINVLNNYDIIVGWNSKNFDLPYIKARLLQHKIYFSFKSLIHIDLMQTFIDSFAVKTRIGRHFITSYSLDNIAKTFINDNKLKIKSGGEGCGGRLWELFNTDRQQLIEYNLQDCVLLKRINNEFNLIKNNVEVAKLVKAPLNKVQNPNPIVDFLVLRKLRRKNIHLNTKRYDIEKVQYEGGYVIDVIPGLYNNINIYDFSSLYPSIIRTFNISPDTLLDKNYTGNCITLPNGCKFSHNKGVLPEILDELTDLRLKYKEEQKILKLQNKNTEALLKEFQQTAIKVVILSAYGVFGSAFFRWFNVDVARSITLTGQALIKNIIKKLNENDILVVGGDTDSIFLQINEEKNRNNIENIIKNAINEIYEASNSNFNNLLNIEHEKTLSKFIILTKKKYVGRCIWEEKSCDYIYFKGIENVKSSELLITKELLEKIYSHILYNNINKKEIIDIILKYKNKIISKDINVDDITIVKKVGKLPEEYKNLPVHVALAVKRQQKGERFYTSMKVPFVVINNKPLTIIHKNEYTGEFDTKYYWENQIYPPTQRLLECVLPNDNWDKFKPGDVLYQDTPF